MENIQISIKIFRLLFLLKNIFNFSIKILILRVLAVYFFQILTSIMKGERLNEEYQYFIYSVYFFLFINFSIFILGKIINFLILFIKYRIFHLWLQSLCLYKG